MRERARIVGGGDVVVLEGLVHVLRGSQRRAGRVWRLRTLDAQQVAGQQDRLERYTAATR